MHDHTPDDSGYEWPTCAAGPDEGPRSHQLWSDELDRLVCRPCEDKTAGRIAELPALFRKLNKTASLAKGARLAANGGSESCTAPIPVRLDVLNLIGPGGVAAKLQAIEDSWRIALGRKIVQRSDGVRLFASWRSHPTTAVPEHVAFLGINLRKACEEYESIGQDVDAIRKLHAECKNIVDDERRPGRVQIGNCPVQLDDGPCWTPLTARADSHRVHCPSCNTRWEGLGEWRELRAAQEAVLAELATRHGAEGVAA